MNVKAKAVSEPTLIPLDLPPLDYSLSLVEMRDAGQYYHTSIHFEENARHYRHSRRDAKRELFLVCFHREIKDSQNPAESELLRELDEIGLQPEGIFELLAVGKHLPGLQRLLAIYARNSDWRNPSGGIIYASLGTDMFGRFVALDEIGDSTWADRVCFLVSRKSSK